MNAMDDYELEKIKVLEEEAMNTGEYMSAALSQYASAHGEGSPECAWILSPYDTWEPNPHYTGKSCPHPEDTCWDYMEEEETPEELSTPPNKGA